MSTFFNDLIYKKLESLGVPQMNTNTRTFGIYIQKYMDKNSEILNHNVPSKRLFFYPNDINTPFEIYQISVGDIEDVIVKMKSQKEAWGIINKINFPLNFLMMNIIRYYELHNDKQGLQFSLMFLTLYQYAGLQYKYYKFLPNEDCMQYTYNRISDKYYFRKYQTVFKALFATVEGNHESMKKCLHTNDDTELLKYLLSLRNRLNNQIKNFTNEYYEDYNSKHYLKLQADTREEENYYETTNMSGDILKIVNTATNRFTTSKVDTSLLRAACGIAKCEQGVMKQALENIRDNELERVRLLILSSIQLYIYGNANSLAEVGSQKFFTYMVAAYSKSNSKNEISLSIKETLDMFLTQYCNRYANTERQATKGNYRKALFIYLILLINKSKNAS